MILQQKKTLLNELCESFDKDKSKFEYVGSTKDVSFYEYMDSKELFNKIKNNQISFDDAQKRQKNFFKNLSEIKMDKKATEQKEAINNLNKFNLLEKKFLIFLKIMQK